MAYEGNTPLGGTMVFECGETVHTQYISASKRGKEIGALDLVFDYLINERYADRRYFDFGNRPNNWDTISIATLYTRKKGSAVAACATTPTNGR